MAASQRKKTEKAEASQQQKKKNDGLSEQLERAERAVEQNRQTAMNLQMQWRTHLLRLCYIVMVVTLHQAQVPTTSCVKEVKVCTFARC